MKPLICFGLIALFLIKSPRHRRLLVQLDAADLSFRAAFGVSPPIAHYVRVFSILAAVSFVVPLALRVIEFLAVQEE